MAETISRESGDRSEYPGIIFRDSPTGTEAYVVGTGLAVWQLVSISRLFNHDVNAVADHLEIQPEFVETGLNYARDFPREVEAAIGDNASYDLERLRSLLPGLTLGSPSSDTGPLQDSK